MNVPRPTDLRPFNPHITREQADAMLAEFKARPCADCGNTFPACCMDAHHVDPRDKARQLRRGASLATMHSVMLQVELTKCVPLCANCHRIRHWKAREARKAAVKDIPRRALSVY